MEARTAIHVIGVVIVLVYTFCWPVLLELKYCSCLSFPVWIPFFLPMDLYKYQAFTVVSLQLHTGGNSFWFNI